MGRENRGRWRTLAAAALLCALSAGTLTACTEGPDTGETAEPADADTTPASSASATAAYAVDAPGDLRTPLLRPDVLISSTKPIPEKVQRRIRALDGVKAAMPLSLASLSLEGRTLTIGSVDVDAYRRWTPQTTAVATDVWKRLAGGEVMVDPSVGRRLEGPRGYLKLGTTSDAPHVHIGAYAPMAKQVSAVVTRPLGERLGMPADNAMLVSTGRFTPSVLTDKMQKILGRTASLQVLALELDTDVAKTAVLTGTSAAEAVGSFRYTAHPSGRITPDPAWVAANIRTEQVPLLGNVTCHRVMIPQLRAALEEVVSRGLGPAIHPDEYAGCYYPRFIGYDPAKGLSLHSWGIAVDLNTPGNQRGTVGEMDRDVVAIFKKWGFAWGGDWNYTDPMHFELASVVRPG
ncbi:M15 family metallopeptidase [Nocardioides iriomotensis]|uniref:M15 family peptidase n=1 Tax=Nocardioides iriomotensis TaxID=715784 RepID=A0A4Q5IW24_9ACTN|nr:M15 family metallopeptidase [Nocardioides iriomotensis]RYU10287.1 M15 family peptidase [Nocardioides iriomotensis]